MAAMTRARTGVVFTGYPPIRMACNTFTPSLAVGTGCAYAVPHSVRVAMQPEPAGLKALYVCLM
eukprot:363801-Chlamydomonas_euryale.AAC.7